MRRLLAGGLAFALGISGATSFAGDQESSISLTDSIILAKPVALPDSSPPVGLARPIPIPRTVEIAPAPLPINDQQVAPAAFTSAFLNRPGLLTLGPRSDTPQPLPAGPTAEPDLPNPRKVETEKPGAGKSSEPRLTPQPVLTGSSPFISDGGDCFDGAPSCEDDGCGEGRCRWWGLFCKRGCCFDQPYRWWATAEYIQWWTKSDGTPALVSTSPDNASRAQAGVLGTPGATVLFGNNGINGEGHSGGRFTTGVWFDRERCLGLEGSFFFLDDSGSSYSNNSSGLPILARPFYNPVTRTEASELVAFPNVIAGGVDVRSSSRLMGADLNLRWNWFRGPCWNLDFLTGFRYMGLDESLNITENLTVPGGAFAGSNILVMDSFTTKNSFYGGQLGLDFEFRCGRWFLGLSEKVGLGNMHESISINGATTFMTPDGNMSVQRGGLLAQASNIGNSSRDRFAVIPETGLRLGYQVTQHMRVFVGYTFLYASEVARPGALIDRAVNPSQLPTQFGPGTLVGPARPAPVFRNGDFWAQGVNIGLELRY